MTKNNLLTTAIVAVIVCILSFYGGTVYQKSKQTSFPNRLYPQGRDINTRAGTNTQRFGRPVSGQISNIEGNTITIKGQDGSSMVIYSDSTTINKTQEGSLSDLVVGEQVMVIGQQDSSGTVTAQTISIGGGMSQFQGQQPP